MARSGSILGNPVVRKEDPKLLTVGGTYVDDVRDPALDGAAHVYFLRSTMAHARITGIDVSAATDMPGVIAVITGADIDMKPVPADMPFFPKEIVRSWLATDRVRYVGEAIVAIVTETRGQGPDAAESVIVDYDPLPVVIDPETAAASTTILHAGMSGNVAFAIPAGDPVDVDASEVVIRQRIVNSKIAPSPIEPRTGASTWSSDGRILH